MPDPSDKDLEDLAFEIAEKSAAKWRGKVSEDVVEGVKARLLAELLGTDEGRLRLRRCLDDPTVDRSDERVIGGEQAIDAIATEKKREEG